MSDVLSDGFGEPLRARLHERHVPHVRALERLECTYHALRDIGASLMLASGTNVPGPSPAGSDMRPQRRRCRPTALIGQADGTPQSGWTRCLHAPRLARG